MVAYLSTLRLLNRDIRFLLAIWALAAFAYFGIVGVLFNLYLLRLGYGPESIGLLHGGGQLVWAAFALPAAMVGQRLGLRTTLLAAQLLPLLGFCVMLWAESMQAAWQTTGLVTGWIVFWIGAAFMTVNSTPYMMARTGLTERNHAFALQQAIIGVSALLGGLVAGVLPTFITPWLDAGANAAAPYRMALWLVPILYAGTTLFAMNLQTVKATQQETAVATGGRAPVAFLAAFTLLVFLIAASEGSVRAFFNVYLDNQLALQVGQIGSIMGISQVLPVAAALAAPLVMARLGIIRSIWVTCVGAAVGLGLVALIPHWLAAAAGFMLLSGAISMSGPARGIFGQQSVSVEWRTTSSAVMTVGLALGWATMAVGGGAMIEQMGFPTLFLTGAAMSLGAATLTVGLWGRSAANPAAAGTHG